jgi:hypothetical protein
MFICLNCEKEFDDALRAKPNNQCRPCKNAYAREWRKQNPDRVRVLNQIYYKMSGDEVRAQQAEYRAKPENREKARLKTRAWYGENKERAAEVAKLYAERRRPMAAARHKKRMQNDPEYAARYRLHMRVCRAQRRAAEAAGIARFYVAQIKAIYAACPVGMEVDHIHPLLGENFSGLHVPWNLQYLPMLENRVKGSKMLEEHL